MRKAPIVAAAAGLSILVGCGSDTPATSPPQPSPTSTTQVLTTQQVMEFFQAAHLRVDRPRDNTAGNCPQLACRELLTTEQVTVMVFDDEADAEHVVETYGSEFAYRHGVVVLSFLGQRTPSGRQTPYRAALDRLIG